MLKRYKKWIWGLVGLVAVAAVLFLALGGNSAGETDTGNESKTAVATLGNLSASATASGQVEAQRSSQLQLTTSGVVAEVYVAVGEVVQANQPLVQLETAVLGRNVANAEQSLRLQQANLADLIAPPTAAELAAAQAAVVSAEAQLADVQDGPSAEELAAAEANLRAAQAEIAAAAARLNKAQAAGSEAEIQAAQYEVAIAQKAKVEAEEAHVAILVSDRLSEDRRAEIEPNFAAGALQANADLEAAQVKLDALLNGDADTIASNRASVAAAVASRDVAQAQLDQLNEGASAAARATAQATLASGQANLASLERGPTAAQRATAEVQVRQAEIQLQQAQKKLAEATLAAPFTGLVTAVNVSPGEQAAGVVVELIDITSLEVVLGVDEVDVGQIVLGQTAVVTLESWPNEEIESRVTAVEPSAIVDSSGIVSFNVHLGLGATQLPILVGMTANANLVTANREGVLLVPNAALTINREAGTYTVNRLQTDADGNQTTSPVEVTIGLSDSKNTEITSGLREGEVVVLGILTASTGDGVDPGGPPGQGFQR